MRVSMIINNILAKIVSDTRPVRKNCSGRSMRGCENRCNHCSEPIVRLLGKEEAEVEKEEEGESAAAEEKGICVKE